MIKIFYLTVFISLNYLGLTQILLPVAVADRTDINLIELTEIGTFGELRKARPKVPEHLHTGVDIKRPVKNYSDEPIFPICDGTIISLRTDGPYAQLIVEHETDGTLFWSVYEHVAGVQCQAGDFVYANTPIARFMNTQELNRFGWQFDHVHLEIMKLPPKQVQPTEKLPYRFFTTYWLSCFTVDDLEKFYYNPLEVIDR